MDWIIYETLNELVKKGKITEEEARYKYKEYKQAQVEEEYMNEYLYGEQF